MNVTDIPDIASVPKKLLKIPTEAYQSVRVEPGLFVVTDSHIMVMLSHDAPVTVPYNIATGHATANGNFPNWRNVHTTSLLAPCTVVDVRLLRKALTILDARVNNKLSSCALTATSDTIRLDAVDKSGLDISCVIACVSNCVPTRHAWTENTRAQETTIRGNQNKNSALFNALTRRIIRVNEE